MAYAKREEQIREYAIFTLSRRDTNWPQHFEPLFQDIIRLKQNLYSAWIESFGVHTPCWPKDIANRAVELAHAADHYKQCGHGADESIWRGLESQVFRNRTEPTCLKCDGRIWQPAISLPLQMFNINMSNNIDAARQRAECRCTEQVRLMPHSTAIAYQGAPRFQYPKAVMDLIAKTTERPDLLFGLKSSGVIYEFIQRQAHSTWDIPLTPFIESNMPASALFPFLICEAKAERNNIIQRDIEFQIAFSCRQMLLTQQRLSVALNKERAFEPLVWCVTYHGEHFELYAAHFTNPYNSAKHNDPDAKPAIDIRPLWNGMITEDTAALQLLLIIDYITNWARHIYRQQIKGCIRKLLNTLGPDLNRSHRSPSLAQSTTSFIYSQNPLSISHEETPVIIQEEQNEDEAISDFFKQFDTQECVYRDASIIESRTIGIVITSGNMTNFLLGSTKSLARLQNISAIFHKGPLYRISGSSLQSILKGWDDSKTSSLGQYGLTDSTDFIMVLSFAAYLSPDWRLVRELSFLAVCTTEIVFFIGECIARAPFTYVSPSMAIDLLNAFQSVSVRANLSACLYRALVHPVFPKSKISDGNDSNTHPLHTIRTAPDIGIVSIRDSIVLMSRECRRFENSSESIKEPYFYESQRVDRKTDTPQQDIETSFSWPRVVGEWSDEEPMVLARDIRVSRDGKELCLFVIDEEALASVRSSAYESYRLNEVRTHIYNNSFVEMGLSWNLIFQPYFNNRIALDRSTDYIRILCDAVDKIYPQTVATRD